jgi:hypothetical protein
MEESGGGFDVVNVNRMWWRLWRAATTAGVGNQGKLRLLSKGCDSILTQFKFGHLIGLEQLLSPVCIIYEIYGVFGVQL